MLRVVVHGMIGASSTKNEILSAIIPKNTVWSVFSISIDRANEVELEKL